MKASTENGASSTFGMMQGTTEELAYEFLSHYIDESSEEQLTLDITHALAHLLHGVNTGAVRVIDPEDLVLERGLEITSAFLGLEEPDLEKEVH